MTMETTPRWALPLLLAGQAQKELFHNEALVRIDALLHGRVESADVASPPSAPTIGQCWIVADGASGDWSGQAGAIACWSEGGWRFVPARAGLCVDVADRDHAMMYDAGGWRDAPLRADGLYMAGQKVVGARQDAIAVPAGGANVDAEARSSISAILAVLQAHGLIGA
ncbi:DUF2793 domain-containing protein [Sphingobium sp.]|uniref:DUF2793 domain-containing protein n=1 Tax=Sphingobium sp. TaxID=1912891 RepID=UPI003BB49DF0